MTERLYHTDSHLFTCESTVLECRATETGFDIRLDRTVLFENAGGQPADTGFIGEARVFGGDEQDGDLWYHCDRAIAPGSAVTVLVDEQRRLDMMRQHTGEHLLSYAFYKLFGINNVGFHLAEEYATIDLDGMLSEEGLLEGERLANGFVMANLPVTATIYPTEEAFLAANLSLRKQSDKAVPPIRIVSILGADTCTCCAPHVNFTGEIGPILITDAMKWKGGMRLTFLCGERALALMEKEHRMLDGMARRFTCSREDTAAHVQKLEADFSELRKREKELSATLDRYLAAELATRAVVSGKVTVLTADLGNGFPPDRLKSIGLKTLSEKNAVALLFGHADGKLCYAVCTSDGLAPDAGEIAKTVNLTAGTKGGGRGTLAQGTGPEPSGFDAVLESMKTWLIRRFG